RAVRPHRFDHAAPGRGQPQLRRIQPRNPQASEQPAARAESRQAGGAGPMTPASMRPASMRFGSMKLVAALVVVTLALAGCSPPPVPDVTYFRLPPPVALPHADKPLSLL